MKSLQERKLNLERLPWVTLVSPRPCDGIKWGTVALKDLYEWGPSHDPNPARGIQDYSRCARQGTWKFTALPTSNARSGVYCMQHVISSGVYGDMDEMDRTNEWFEQNGWADA